MIMTTEREYLTLAEAQRRFGVTYRALQRWIAAGKIHPYEREAGSRKMVSAEEVERAARIVPRS